MESATSALPPPPAACTAGCRYAEPLRDDYADWIWCTRPDAPQRLRQVGSDCSAAPAAGWSRTIAFD